MPRRKTHEEFVAEVKALVGDEYTVVGTYQSARLKLSFRHTNCGGDFEMTPNHFLTGTRCIHCALKRRVKKRTKSHSTFLSQVEQLGMGEYELLSEYTNDYTKVNVKHIVCGEEYFVSPNMFLRGRRCPRCKESRGERRIRKWLELKDVRYVAQYPVFYRKNKRPLLLDFYINGIAIEYDGEYHYKILPHTGEKRLIQQRQKDAIKTQYCADNGIPLIRIPYWDFDNIDAILTEKLLPLLKVDASSTQKQAS